MKILALRLITVIMLHGTLAASTSEKKLETLEKQVYQCKKTEKAMYQSIDALSRKVLRLEIEIQKMKEERE